MKLIDIYVVVHGHLIGPLLATTPQNHKGDDVYPAKGDDVLLLIRDHKGSGPHLYAKARLEQS